MSTTSSLRHTEARPASPHTPQQQFRSGNNSFASTTSPGSSFRNEDDAIIFELGARWLRAGFEGSSAPMCVVGFGPEKSRRAGDYRGWTEGNAGTRPLPKPLNADDWVREYELWRLDLRQIDLGLVEDKIERVFRETYNEYLLTDAGSSRLVLVLPSLMPHPILSSLLSTLFSRWRFPSITLLPSATMSATAAGLRSALVVDLGWAETTVTPIYEYREITTKRSTRAMKAVVQDFGRLFTGIASGDSEKWTTRDEISVGFQYCEEISTRLAWCQPRSRGEEAEDTAHNVSVPSPIAPEESYVDVPFARFAEPVENVFYAPGAPEEELDDEEKPLPLLIYNTLLALLPDARGTCMSRIIFVGGGARIPGLRQRTIDEIKRLIDLHGWSPIRGKAVERQRQRLQEMRLSSQTNTNKQATPAEPSSPADEGEAGEEKKLDPSQEEPEVDPVEQKLQRQNKDTPTPIQGILREVESLGPWTGASLVTSLKIRGLVEVEREKFLQHGLAGGTRELENPVPDRRSGLRGGDRSSWTLAGWA